MRRNPDNEFVLHGRQTPLRREKPREHPTNSQRTISTRNLSQNTFSRLDSNRSWRDTQQRSLSPRGSLSRRSQEEESVFDAESLFGSMNGGTAARQERKERSLKPRDGLFSLDFTGLSNSFGKSLNKSVSFSKDLERHKANSSRRENEEDELEETFEEELQRLIDDDIRENDQYEQDLAGKPKAREESQWFTEPVHLTQTTDYPVFQSLGLDTTRTSPVNRTTGMLGTDLAQQKIANQMMLDDIARDFFPVTLGEMPSIMRTVTPQPPSTIGKKYARSRSATDSASRSTWNGKRASSALGSSSLRSSTRSSTGAHSNPKTGASYDYNYLQASKPFVDQTVTATPYHYRLAQLKMERLRLEEQRLLESKRKEELERIRGPTPKWYELKTPQFTYELHKNNKLLESKEEWQNLMDYRDQLTKSSQDFAKMELGGYFH